MVRGAWQASVPGVDKSWTGLKSTYTCMYQALYEDILESEGSMVHDFIELESLSGKADRQ